MTKISIVIWCWMLDGEIEIRTVQFWIGPKTPGLPDPQKGSMRGQTQSRSRLAGCYCPTNADLSVLSISCDVFFFTDDK